MEGRSDGVNHVHARTVWLAASIAFKITISYSGPCFSCCGDRGATIGNLNFCCAYF